MAMILEAFLPKFSEFLVQMVQDEVGMLLAIPGQIEMLYKIVGGIQCVLADAERKQSKGNAINSKDINLRLEVIAKSKADLGLTELQIFPEPSDQVRRVDSIISHKPDPSFVLADIVGDKIEEDTELLVKWLIEEDKGVREKVGVVAIVRMGGTGKTTLAKRIFNDLRTREEFQLKIWICISKQVQGEEVLMCMIREAGGEHGAARERSELVPLLERLVKGKKFLLVLDDVWQESRAVWDNLLKEFMGVGFLPPLKMKELRKE